MSFFKNSADLGNFDSHKIIEDDGHFFTALYFIWTVYTKFCDLAASKFFMRNAKVLDFSLSLQRLLVTVAYHNGQ